MSRRRLVGVSIAFAMVGAAACAEPAGAPWGAEAEQWVSAWNLAGAEGQVNRLDFMTEDLVFEDRTGSRVLHGPSEVVQRQTTAIGPVDPAQQGLVFLSAGEVLEQSFWPGPDAVDRTTRFVMQDERVARVVDGASVASALLPPSDRDEVSVAEAVAQRYVRFWDEGGAALGQELYTPGVTVQDTLLGETVRGRAGVVRSVGSGRWPDLPAPKIEPLGPWPDETFDAPRGQAVYVAPASVEPPGPAEVRLVVEVDDGSTCPGLMAVVLLLEGERVAAERRFHEVASARRCYAADELRPGWWEGITVPEPVRIAETEPMVWPEQDLTVGIHNGDRAMTSFVRWGLARYVRAGLTPPNVTSVTFLSQASRCTGYHGFFHLEGETVELILCYTPEEVCLDAHCVAWKLMPRQTLLHELAHAWLRENIDKDLQAEFLALEGLDRWSDHGDAWEQRAVEQAAETLAYGVSERWRADWCATEGGTQRAVERYTLLTGLTPLARCP